MHNSLDIAAWAEILRDISASGLHYSDQFYDRERYKRLNELAIEMSAAATGTQPSGLSPLQRSLFEKPGPFVGSDAAIFDDHGRILLIRRSDNNLWAMPGGAAEVGETPAETAAREALEESGVTCRPIDLVGIYDNRKWGSVSPHHAYMIVFLCEPTAGADLASEPSHSLEITDRAWFTLDQLPADLDPRHQDRIPHAFAFKAGETTTYFDS